MEKVHDPIPEKAKKAEKPAKLGDPSWGKDFKGNEEFDDPEKGPKKGKTKAAKKKKEEKDLVEIEHGDDEEGEPFNESKIRIVPPRKTFSGSATEDFEKFERAVEIWKGKYMMVSDRRLGSELMEVITGDAEDIVFARVKKGAEDIDSIMEALSQVYGPRLMPKTTAAINEFEDFRRGKRTLRTF